VNRLSTAAAFHGSAENPVYSVQERLRLALAALTRYEATVEEIRTWCEAQDKYSKGESLTTAQVRAILEKEEPPPPTPNTKEENIEFRKQWDERVDRGQA
jgi:hypothetical protein